MTFTMSITTQLTPERAVEVARQALADNGFGVLTEIDLQATLQQKLGTDIGPCRILGACRPPLAAAAYAADKRVATLLPCNVVIRSEGGATIVEAMDPALMPQVSGTDAFDEVAADARVRLQAALDAVAAVTS